MLFEPKAKTCDDVQQAEAKKVKDNRESGAVTVMNYSAD